MEQHQVLDTQQHHNMLVQEMEVSTYHKHYTDYLRTQLITTELLLQTHMEQQEVLY